MKYPRKLSAGANNTVIILSVIEVGKLYLGDRCSEIGNEAAKMQHAKYYQQPCTEIYSIRL